MRLRRAVLAPFIAAAILVAPLVSGASADPVGGYTGWSGNHGLPYAISAGDLVAFWQSILYVDGYLSLCGSNGIDGYFGTGTGNATYNWQSAEGITADYTAGPQTWGQANIYNFGGSTYYGTNQQLPLASGGAGLFFRNPVNTTFQTTDHYTISFGAC